MAAAAISSGMAFVLLALSAPLPGDERPLDDHRFDLAAMTLIKPRPAVSLTADQRFDKPLHDPAQLVGPGWEPPAKTWGRPTEGPVVQIGALGSKDKRIPDLAHVSLDWDF